MLPQNKIVGTNIAWARAVWAYLEDGSEGFDFPESDAFKITVNPETLEQMGVKEDDLLDCVAQIQSDFGDPDNHRTAFGLLPHQGYAHVGIVVISRSNPKVRCSFTPTSLESKRYDGYFAWYFDNVTGDKREDLGKFMIDYDRRTASRSSRISLSPAMPTYGEACERTEQSKVMTESERQSFLGAVWSFHKTPSQGYKNKISEECLPLWEKILEESDEQSSMEDFKSELRKASPSRIEVIIDDLTDLDRHYKETLPDDPNSIERQREVQAKLQVAHDALRSKQESISFDLPID